MTVTDNPGGYHGSCATGGPRGTLHISTMIPCYHMIITGCFLGVSSYSVGGNNILTNFILQLYQLLPVWSPHSITSTNIWHQSATLNQCINGSYCANHESQFKSEMNKVFSAIYALENWCWLFVKFIPLRKCLHPNLTFVQVPNTNSPAEQFRIQYSTVLQFYLAFFMLCYVSFI